MNARINQSPHRHAKLTAVMLLLGFSLISLFSANSFATQASPEPFTIEQPDGQKITAKNQGDEWNNWVETQDGYTIAQDKNGFWYYVSGFSAPTSAPKLNTQGLDQGGAFPQQPVLTEVPATDPPPPELLKHLHPANQRPSINLNMAPANVNQNFTLLVSSNTTGARNIVFILAEFDDQKGTYLQPTWATFVTNKIGDYFGKAASYGKVTITPAQENDSSLGNGAVNNNGVIGWINISPELKALEVSLGKADQTGNYPNTVIDNGQYQRLIAKAAMQAADPYIDYSQYDADLDDYVTADELAVVVIVAGYEASYNPAVLPSVWGHAGYLYDVGQTLLDGKRLGELKSGVGPLGYALGYAEFGERHGSPSNYHQATMGIMVHELGHEIFGMADLYDVNSTLAPDGELNEGLGSWSVMAGGSWARKTGENSGATPVLPDAWTKLQMGWITPIPQRDRVLLTGAGLATATSDNSVYKASTNGAPTEYFLIENRQNKGYDQGLQSYIPGFSGGLAILHIDDSISCSDNVCNSLDLTKGGHPHPRVYLEAGNRTWITVSLADQKDLFYAKDLCKPDVDYCRTKLDGFSTPTNSNLWNGAVKGNASGVSINSITNSLDIMRVRVPQ
jgi:immune inhibitor A